MKEIPWLKIGLAVSKFLPTLIQRIEVLHGPGNGAAKQAAVIDIVTQSVAAVDEATGKDLMQHPKVQAALKAANDALVAVQNVIAEVGAAQTAAAAAPASS